ncbi:MAG: hypothetical protein N2166_05825 [candidate division WOR-3 bacterium]|nr:hypothetical protein [candidate division WOR-3 bacterium]
MNKSYFFLSVIVLFVGLVSVSCERESFMRWPWETREDSLAVNEVLTIWRDSINGLKVINAPSYPLNISIPLVPSDTARRTTPIDSLIKIAKFRDFRYVITERPRFTEYIFGRKNDSIETRDTFCYVTYQDSADCIAIVGVDSVWRIRFTPDTAIDTTVTPPETTISYYVTSISKNYYSAREAEWHFGYKARRYLELRKENGAPRYYMRYLTGFGTYLPDNSLAPTISNIILKKISGETDTFRYRPTHNRRGIMNLFKLDSLYTVNQGDSVELKITLSGSDSYLVYISWGRSQLTSKYFLPVSNNVATKKISFSELGLNHLYIEVLGLSGLAYPTRAFWPKTVWALPVRVIE